MAHDPSLTTKVLNVSIRAISNWLRRRARKLRIAWTLKIGAMTVIQRFDSVPEVATGIGIRRRQGGPEVAATLGLRGPWVPLCNLVVADPARACIDGVSFAMLRIAAWTMRPTPLTTIRQW